MTVETYLAGVEAIYRENPSYQLGHDGSDGSCDCIGMCKGAIKRGGESPTGLQGTNYAARYTIKEFGQIPSVSALSLGDVVLKGRKPGDSGYDLPQRYRSGGSDCTGDLTDYYHIGTVTGVNPLEITHMTSPHAKKDTKLGKWGYYGKLPQVNGGEPVPELMGIVTAPSGSTVNMRKRPSATAALVERVPIGAVVDVLEQCDEWYRIRWDGKTGYMMKKFIILEQEPPVEKTYTVIIPGLSESEANALCEKYPNAEKEVG